MRNHAAGAVNHHPHGFFGQFGAAQEWAKVQQVEGADNLPGHVICLPAQRIR